MKFAVLETDSYVSRAIGDGNLWQPEVLFRLLEAAWTCPNATLVEIGSYIGDHTIHASEWYDRVIAVEPLFADVLRENLMINGITNVEVIEAAVGGSSMTRDSENPGHSRLGEGEPVKTITLNDIMPEEGPVVLKMDIEGAEYMALKDADLSRVEWIILEIDNKQLRELSGVSSEDVLAILDRWGFGDYHYATGQRFSPERLPSDWFCDIYARKAA